jgi:steroid delta-isomerase
VTETGDTASRPIFERWLETVLARDLDGLMDLYAEDAVLESPLILMTLTDAASGILRGRSEIRPFFAAGLREAGNGLGRWYRTGRFFSDGRQPTWEYPRATPQGDQVDLVEVVDLAAGRIAHHRVYRGWVGFRVLTGRAARLP